MGSANILGPGLLESCYQDAYCVELKKAGIPFEREKVFALCYRGECMQYRFLHILKK